MSVAHRIDLILDLWILNADLFGMLQTAVTHTERHTSRIFCQNQLHDMLCVCFRRGFRLKTW